MPDIPKLMTRNFVYDLRSRADEVTDKVIELLNAQFEDKVKDSSKGNQILLTWQVSGKKNAKAELSLVMELKSDDYKKPILTIEGKTKGDKEAAEELKTDCVERIFKVKKPIDGYIKDLVEKLEKEDKEPVEEKKSDGKLPQVLTDKEWKRCKDMTLTDTGIGDALNDWQEHRKQLGSPEKLGYQVFDQAKKSLENLSECLKKGKQKAIPGLHNGSVRAIEAFEKLVATQTTKLEESRKEYKKKIDEWSEARKQDLVNVEIWDRKIREYVSTEAKEALTKLKEASIAKEEQAIEVAIGLMKDAIKGLEQLKEKALEAYKTASANLSDKSAPVLSDWSKEVQGLPKLLKQTIEKISNNQAGATTVLNKGLEKASNK